MNEEQFINDFYKGNDYRKFEVLKEMYRENQQLKEQLKQRDEVIDEAIKILGELGTQLIIIDNSDYVYKQEEICNKVFEYQRKILDILKNIRK